MTADVFEIVRTSQGAVSIRDGRVGEIMHNPLGPWREIEELYLKPAKLATRLQSLLPQQELILFDVGLGAGSNAMAALLIAQQSIAAMSKKVGFRILSFEQDLSLASFAIDQQKHFPEFSWAWQAFEQLLAAGQWQHPELPLQWQLYPGDFVKTLENSLPTADIIFYDPYSPQKNPEMWSYGTFKKLRQKCHNDLPRESLLLTYSRATSVRAALLLAGFYVGQGNPLGLKEETTQAANSLAQLTSPLAGRWLERWQRSHVPLPADLTKDPAFAPGHWEEQLKTHPQFK